jgi:hypothetical protein
MELGLFYPQQEVLLILMWLRSSPFDKQFTSLVKPVFAAESSRVRRENHFLLDALRVLCGEERVILTQKLI